MRLSRFSAFLLLLMVAAAACSEAAEEAQEPRPVAVPGPQVPERPDLKPLVEGEMSPDGLQAILGTGDLAVGANRVGFVLISRQGLVTEPTVTVSSRYLTTNSSSGEPGQTVSAQFHPWPYGTRGLYVSDLTFDRAGRWGIDVEVQRSDGPVSKTELLFDVREKTFAPAVGAPAVKSSTKTVGDVETLAELTTGSLQDPDLYAFSLADAVANGSPTVVVFASPAFCTNAVCGPQVDVLQELKDAYKGRADFVHVDFYDNPQEIQGDLERARISPAVKEWRLPSIEWTYVIDRQGIVAARFEAFATYEEVEEALLEVL